VQDEKKGEEEERREREMAKRNILSRMLRFS
jgi:hypothetical protein